MSRPKSPQRLAMEQRLGLSVSIKKHRMAALELQLIGCANDEARRLILHGTGARSKKPRVTAKLSREL